jgi:hypothetical protein
MEVNQQVYVDPFGTVSYFEPTRREAFSLCQTEVGSELNQRRATEIKTTVHDSKMYYYVLILDSSGNSYVLKENQRLSEDFTEAKLFETRSAAITAELGFGQGRLFTHDGQTYIDCEGMVDA